MKKNVAVKTKKELDRRFGKMAESITEYEEHIDLRSWEDFDDEAFAFVMQNVKGVNMLDLNETDITNDSITLLTGLEYVNELRAKECRNLDNNCVDDLNKLTTLVFLHLKNTNITVDGLLKLTNLSKLETLMFSADDIELIKEKLLNLKTMLPQCEIVINSKPYYFDTLDLFLHALQTQPFTYRLKIQNQSITDNWSNRLSHPEKDSIEAESQGTYALDDIEWVDINPIVRIEEEPRKIKEQDHSEYIIRLLENLTFPFMINDGIISAYVLRLEI